MSLPSLLIDLIHLRNLVIIINLFSHHVFQRVQMMLIVLEFEIASQF